VLHGALTYLLSDDDGQISPAHSISAGLDYPGVGPEHAWYADTGRASYVAIDDETALKAFHLLAQVEGIVPALETAHAVAHVLELAPTLSPEAVVVLVLSGRGDKDAAEAMRLLQPDDEAARTAEGAHP
jgi:tryptophan synthase beta chain